MDQLYLYSLVSFVFGSAAGFQGIYGRYAKDAVQAIKTPPGGFYIISRGLVPSSVFAAAVGLGIVTDNLLAYSVAAGTGVELFLRTKLFVKQSDKNGIQDELYWGPFNLLQWYQNLLLTSVEEYLAGRRLKFVKQNLPLGKSFQELATLVKSNMAAFSSSDELTELVKKLIRLEEKYYAESAEAASKEEVDRTFSIQLGLLVLNKKGILGFKTLMTV